MRFLQLLAYKAEQLFVDFKHFFRRAGAAAEDISRCGFQSFWKGYLERRTERRRGKSYAAWIAHSETSSETLEIQRTVRFRYEPLVSIVVPVYETPESMLTDMIRSVFAQTYGRWELCISDGASRFAHVREVLEVFKAKDVRVKVLYLAENRGISGNTNAAIGTATGDFIAFLDHDDILSSNALFEMVKAINEQDDVDMLYSDEDKISSVGHLRQAPYFKPDFSPDLLRTGNYMAHFLLMRKSFGDALGWLRPEFDGAQDYDLILRASEKARRIVHVSRILYHWRKHAGSAASGCTAKPYAEQAGIKALLAHLNREGLEATVENGGSLYTYKVNYNLTAHPLVSIIIPNKDQAALLKRCLDSILNISTYKNFEIIIVENQSRDAKTQGLYDDFSSDPRVKVVVWDQPFNYSAINNFAVTQAEGDVLLFLNNDTEVINSDWIERMMEYVLRQDVGVVGAKLYYPDNTLQHAGVIVGLRGTAGHVLTGHRGDSPGLFSRLKRVQNYSAVTGACLMMRRDIFMRVNGFSADLPVAFNDVDLCLKVREKGYLVVWTPYAELIHYESKTRGYEETPEKQERFRNEQRIFRNRWRELLAKGDPYYNRNLTLIAEDYSLRICGDNSAKGQM